MTARTERACNLTVPIFWAPGHLEDATAIPVPRELVLNAGNHPHVLGIFAPSTAACKITLYYLDEPDVTKLTTVLDKIDNETIVAVSSIINEVKDAHIHVSGFCQKDGQYVYEIYARGKEDIFSSVAGQLRGLAHTIAVMVERVPLLGTPA